MRAAEEQSASWTRPEGILSAYAPATVQAVVGYCSAALGLACELTIAARFGANSVTDVYRWAGLAPFYANVVLGGILVPIFFGSRLFAMPLRRIHVLKKGADGKYAFAANLTVLSLLAALLTGCGMLFVTVAPNPASVYVESFLLALAFLVYSVMMAPLFYHGWIWVIAAGTAIANCVLLCLLLSQLSNFYVTVGLGMGASALIVLALPWLAIRKVDGSKFDALAKKSSASRPLPLSRVSIVALANLASIVSTVIYFAALSWSGAGVLSLYTTTQKAGLILAVPASAILNKFLRDDLFNTRENSPVSRAVKAVIPIVLVSPLFAVASFSLLCVVYRISPLSHEGMLIGTSCGASASLAALTSCLGMLTVARESGEHAVVPSFITIAVAAVGALIVYELGQSSWSISIPIFGSALASIVGMSWISKRTGRGMALIWSLGFSCFLLAVLMISALTREPLVQLPEAALALETFIPHHW